ncbi:unnamed protein product, partial [Acanthoscelides obtectus]
MSSQTQKRKHKALTIKEKCDILDRLNRNETFSSLASDYGEENVELLDHPLYSPDLSPNDFFTFPKIRNRLHGQRFQSPEETVDDSK